VQCIEMDLSIQGKATELYEACKRQKIQVDYLVNNAGYGITRGFLKAIAKFMIICLP
jgi:short-subunit dehydrogenase